MSIVDKTTLKSYFVDGIPPVESNYIDLIDSMALVDYIPAAQIPLHLNLPGIRSYWNLAAITKNSEGTFVPDLVSGGDLLKNSTPLSSVTALTPRLYFDGSDDYLSSTFDEHFSISGSESDIDTAYRGISFGCWVNPASLGTTNKGLIGKWIATTGNREYLLYINTSSRAVAVISQDGSAVESVTNTRVLLNTSAWFFIALSWSNANDLLYCYVNNTSDTLATTYTAIRTIGINSFEIGRYNNTNYYQGWMSSAFICGAYLPPEVMTGLFSYTKKLYGY